MLVLAFDTAGSNCAVALVRGGEGMEVLARVSETLGRGHAERLLPMIDEVLSRGGLAYTGLGRIAVTTGPGSFTGVRVGVAAARALALALDIPAVGVGSLEALALPAIRARYRGTVVAVLDARRGEVYAMAFDIASASTVVAPIAAPTEAIASQIADMAHPLILTGAGAPLLRAALGDTDAEVACLAECPDIADVARLGLRADAMTPPVPVYARGADAKPQAGMAVARRFEARAPELLR